MRSIQQYFRSLPLCGKRTAFLAALLLFPSLPRLEQWAQGEDPHPTRQTLDLGGPRQVKVQVTVSPHDYHLHVRMLSVQAFDVKTNDLLNHTKARAFGLQALGRHLSDKESIEFSIMGATVKSSGLNGKFYTLTMVIPRSGVVLHSDGLSRPAPIGQKIEQVVTTSALFTRKREYLTTIQQLVSSSRKERCLLEQEAKARKESQENGSRAVKGLERRVQSNFMSLAEEVRQDLLLFSSEQTELTAMITSEWKKLVKEIQEIARKEEANQSSEKTPDGR